MNTVLITGASGGGPDAPIEPAVSAGKIFDLIKKHKTKLTNGTLVDTDSLILPF